MALTAPQISTIQATIPLLQSHGKEVTQHFYKNLLSANPSLKSIFNLTHQRQGSQPFALASVLVSYARHITNPSSLTSAVEAINHRHASLGVTPPQYDLVGAQLLASMGVILGTDVFTEEVKSAWAAAYGSLAGMMIAREQQLYDSASKPVAPPAASTERVDSVSATPTSSTPEAKPAWGPDFRACTIVSRTEEAKDIISLRFRPTTWPENAPLPHYEPGQYISLRVPTPSEGEGVWQIRQYTLSDAPHSACKLGYRITPKKIGEVSEILHGLNEGDEVQVSFPRGVFWYRDDSIRAEGNAQAEKEAEVGQKKRAPLVLISAGIGVTPMMSILSSLEEEEGVGRRITWLHSTRRKEEQPFQERLAEIGKRNEALRFRVFVTGEDAGKLREDEVAGRVDLGKLSGKGDLYLNDEKALYYLCGPTEFMEAVGKDLKGLGVHGEHIKTEVFGAGSASF